MRNHKDVPPFTSTTTGPILVGAPALLGRAAILRAIGCLPHNERLALLSEVARSNSLGTATFGSAQNLSKLELETLMPRANYASTPGGLNRAARRAKRGKR